MSARILGSPTMCCVLPPYIVVNNNTTIGGVQHSMATLVLRTKTAYLLPTMTERTLGQHLGNTLPDNTLGRPWLDPAQTSSVFWPTQHQVSHQMTLGHSKVPNRTRYSETLAQGTDRHTGGIEIWKT
jgi:hypothetical protein